MFNYLKNNWALTVDYTTKFCIATAVLCGITTLVLLLTGFCELASASEPVTRIEIETIVQIESSGDPNAYNKHSEARGLMQITPICLKEYNQYKKEHYKVEHLFDEQVNITIGTWYINKRIPQMLKYYGIDNTSIKELDLYIIACYNWGIGNVVKWYKKKGKIENLPQETQNYWRKYVTLNKSKQNKF